MPPISAIQPLHIPGVRSSALLNSKKHHVLRFSAKVDFHQLTFPKGKRVAAQIRYVHGPKGALTPIVENEWLASGVLVSHQNKLEAKFGRPDDTVIARSTIKPIHAAILHDLIWRAKNEGQTVPRLTTEEWAVLAASHSGTQKHRTHIESIMKKFGIQKDTLVCGTHPPLNSDANEELIRTHQKPDVLHHQCSGHHTCLQAMAKLLKLPDTDYQNPKGKLQRFLHQELQRYFPKTPLQLVQADGCNIPTYALPLVDYAQWYSDFSAVPLINPKKHPSKTHQDEGLHSIPFADHIAEVMNLHPDLVADRKSMDTQLMRVTGGRLIAKTGVDGLICIADRKHKKALVIKVWSSNGPSTDAMRDKITLKALVEQKLLKRGEYQQLVNMPQFALEDTMPNGKTKKAYVFHPQLWEKASRKLPKSTINSNGTFWLYNSKTAEAPLCMIPFPAGDRTLPDLT